MSRIRWSEKRTFDLAFFAREGYSASEISRKMGDISRSAILAKASREGIKLYGHLKFFKHNTNKKVAKWMN